MRAPHGGQEYSAAVRYQTAENVAHYEGGIAGADDEVAAKGEIGAETRCRSVDGSDSWFRYVVEHRQQVMGAALALPAIDADAASRRGQTFAHCGDITAQNPSVTS